MRDAGIPLRADDDIEAFYAEQVSVDRRALLVDALAWDGSKPEDFLAWVVGDDVVRAQMDDDVERTVLPDDPSDEREPTREEEEEVTPEQGAEAREQDSTNEQGSTREDA